MKGETKAALLERVVAGVRNRAWVVDASRSSAQHWPKKLDACLAVA